MKETLNPQQDLTHVTRHQKKRQVALPSSLTGWRCASCAALGVLLHLVCIHQVVIVSLLRVAPVEETLQQKMTTGTDRLHLQTGLVRLKLEGKKNCRCHISRLLLRVSISLSYPGCE